MSSIVAVGSMAFDSIETPFGREEKILGGSVNHFSLAASNFASIHCVSVIGKDFPEDHLRLFQSRNIDIRGIKKADGNTFHWAGRYGYDLNEAHTLDTQLNVFESFEPELPESYRDCPYVFLGNIHPKLQMKVLDQVKNPRFIALDTMNFWIEGAKADLIEALSRVHALVINEGEVRQLTDCYNIVEAAEKVHQWGPQILVVKRGEYGSILFQNGEAFGLPALPLSVVKDPTGAGDSFAGGFMGYIASQGEDGPVSRATLRKAMVYGSVMASFIVQDFGFRELLKCDRPLIDERYQRFVELTTFHTE